MNANDIQMCVVDTLQDDDMESMDLILKALNSQENSSWRAARGQDFSPQEVQAALVQLMAAGLVTPCAEQPPAYECIPISFEQVGKAYTWEAVWFHLEQAGREAFKQWWNVEGQLKYPTGDLDS